MPDKTNAAAFFLAALVIVVIGACAVILCWRGDVHNALTFAALLSVSPLQLLQWRPTNPAPAPGTVTATATKSLEVTPP